MPTAPTGPDNFDDLHPIDIAEVLAEHYAWEFDRVAEDQIALTIDGQWRSYSLSLAWNANDDTLRLVCTFPFDLVPEKQPALYDLLNQCNDLIWCGAFTWWAEQKLIVWRYGLAVDPEQLVTSTQVNRLLAAAVKASERFFPAFALIAMSHESPGEALQVAINEAYGRA